MSTINLIDDKALPEQLQEHKICCIEDNKDLYLLHLLELHNDKIIIFVNSKDRMKTLATKLKMLKIECAFLSSGLTQHQRFESLKKFIRNDSKILVTTDLCARGLDINSINIIIHYDIPRTREVFFH